MKFDLLLGIGEGQHHMSETLFTHVLRFLRQDEINRRWKKGSVRAALPDDAPFALAIGASILSTLVLPVGREQAVNNESYMFGPDDVQTGAMQIISFIPLFNWLVNI